jgi:uncharacterized membrane protein YqaE (UPF0057 family)
MEIIKILRAIFCSPIAAFLQVGFSAYFFINSILTLLSGIPYMNHALWLVISD